MSPSPTRIISICDDFTLRQSRKLLLEREGYEVHSFSSRESLDPKLVQTSHLVIICQSAARSILTLRAFFRQWNPDIRLLDLGFTPDHDRDTTGAPMMGGQSFLRVVSAFLGVSVASAKPDRERRAS